MNHKLLLIFVIVVVIVEGAYAPLPGHQAFNRNRHVIRNGLIKRYFDQGYACKDIIVFVETLHGIRISMDWLRKVLRKMGLRRHMDHNERTLQRIFDAIRTEQESSGKWIRHESVLLLTAILLKSLLQKVSESF